MWCGLLHPCCGGQGRPFGWWVRWLSAALPSLGACALVLCPLGVLPPRGVLVLWRGASGPPRVCWVPYGPVPLPPCRLLSWVSRPCPLPPLVPVPLPVWWPLLWPGSSPGGEGVVVGCLAVFSVAPSVPVASSARVGVPSFPCAGSRGRWARGTAVPVASSPFRGGASWRGCTSGARALSAEGGAVLVLLLWRALPRFAPWCPPLRPLSLCHGPWPFLFLAFWWFLAPVLCRPRCPVPVGACLLPLASPCPLAVGPPFALSLPGVVLVGFGGGLPDADGPCLGVGCLEPWAEGFGGAG